MTASSPLPVQRLRTLIATEGAIPIATFMAIANAHYYASRDPLGRSGDFTTAPEISQMFGELIGLWMADLWMRAGSPPVAIVELGPGRGTLMADLRRAISRFPGLSDARTHFVETSPTLRTEQKQRVPDAFWHDSSSTLPTDLPLLIIANEFFDALPIRQIVRTDDGWRERMVTLHDDRLIPVPGKPSVDPLVPRTLAGAPTNSIIEASPAGTAIMADLATRIEVQGGAALVIDYGYEGPAVGDTLQAVKDHGYADVFDRVGEVDLTAHVDFTALKDAARKAGAVAHGPVDQGALLTALGIAARAQALARANPARTKALEADMRRLTAPEEMGTLFKAIAVTAPDWPKPAAF